MKFLKAFGVILLIIILIVLIGPLFLSGDFNIERTATIDAPLETVHSQVNELENWEHWSPWREEDPDAEITYSDPSSGQGAWYTWSSEVDRVGSGKLTLTEVSDDAIATELDFGDAGMGYGNWKFEEADGGTKVSWSFSTQFDSYFSRWFSVMMKGPMKTSMDKGLTAMKEHAEANPEPPAPETEEMTYSLSTPEIVELPEMPIYSIRETHTLDGLEAFFTSAYGELFPYVMGLGIEMSHPPSAIYHSWPEDGIGEADVEAAIPVNEIGEVPAEGRIKTRTIPANTYLKTTHTGSYDFFEESYGQIMAYIQENNLTITGPNIEIYATDPGQEPDPNKWVTEIYFPVEKMEE